MHYDGFRDVKNVDYAPTCIEQLRRLHAHFPGLSYAVADCRRCACCDPAADLRLWCMLVCSPVV